MNRIVLQTLLATTILAGCSSTSSSGPRDSSGGRAAQSGGHSNAGGASSGGASSGGAIAGSNAAGGNAAGGNAAGGNAAGGNAAGGNAAGGNAAGGNAAGGNAAGGNAAGGNAAGGNAAGGNAAGGNVGASGGNTAQGGKPGAGGTIGVGGSGAGGVLSGGRANGGSGAGGSGGSGNSSCSGHSGFWVDGRHLRDRCCEKVVLRGVNEMVVWTGNQDGTPYFAEIAQTGANVVRIVWETAGSVSKLDAAIKTAIDNKLIPMPELHDATGNLSKLTSCIDYWVRSDVVAVLKKYEANLLVNIANEVGDGSVTQAAFTSAYQQAVTRMRNAGIHVPLIIDAPSWGQDVNMLQAAGPGLITADPDHNLMFSVHMWWNDPQGTRVTSELNESVNANLPLIVGEFAQHGVTGCASAPFAYKTLLSLSKSLEVGWLAWSWGGVKNSDCASDGPFNMTSNGTFASLGGWGLEVAKSDPNSIQNTSVRPRSMTAGSCN